jgi:cyclitol oxidoreductase
MEFSAELSGKIVLITGGSSGIGHAMASALATAGCRVTIVSRRPPEQWEEGVPHGWDADDWIRADLADGILASKALDQWLDKNGDNLDAVVTSAVDYASAARHPFEETTLEEWNALFNANARGAFLVVRATLPYLLRREKALLVAVTSDVAFQPGPFRVGYSASKMAARALFDGLAAEMAERCVNVVQLLPVGQVATPGLRRRRPKDFDFSGFIPSSVFASPICQIVRDLGTGMNGRIVEVGGQAIVSTGDGSRL